MLVGGVVNFEEHLDDLVSGLNESPDEYDGDANGSSQTSWDMCFPS